MKVTVCFGNVRVVVPCGDGDILVRDLIREATLRYKKATGKSNDQWVAVHNLQSVSGGGILDPDDRLSDVADDREQIVANFEDGDGAHHGGGDGASGSSVGTGSPDIFHGSDKYPTSYSRTDIEVTGEQIASGLSVPLQVRRGSEPALNQIAGSAPPVPDSRPPIVQDPSKRWSAAPIILDEHINNIDHGRLTNGYLSPDWDDQEEDETPFQRIARDGSNRLSMQFLGDGAGYRWAEAAEKAALNTVTPKHKMQGSKSLPRDHRRKEPLGQANTSTSSCPSSSLQEKDSSSTETIVIRNEAGQLGVHVVPDYDRMGKERGLLVQGIEPGGRIDRDGKLAVNDRIVEINGQALINIPFNRVQEIFKTAQSAPELSLKIIKKSSIENTGLKPPAPIFPRSSDIIRLPEDKENVAMVEVEEKMSTNTKVATVSPTKKIPPGSRNPKSLLTANTRKIGRKIELELVKGPHGLGFSITTRDNPAGGNCPIYIKNILPKGAAVEDGRLKPGDRLLEVNGVEMTGKSQTEAVTVLRNAPSGSTVRIVVSRQEDVSTAAATPSLPLPRVSDMADVQVLSGKSRSSSPTAPAIPPLPNGHDVSNGKTTSDRFGSVAKIISQFQEAAAKSTNSSPMETKNIDDSSVFPWKHREILTFNIPVHDSEKAGLGVSVKGKTTGGQGGTDLGIFVKSVLHGGAASRDKRLRTNDQLLNVNGISLLHQSNSEAMETLRKAMLHTEGPVPGSITLTVARRVPSPGPQSSGRESISSLLTDSSGPETFVCNSNSQNESSYITDNSGTSEQSGNTVIFLPYSKRSETSLNNSNNSNNRSIPGLDSWNPVIDRITGQNNNPMPSSLRNESYYIATHDHTLNGSLKQETKYASPTINLPSGETIMIENEYVSNYPSSGFSNRNSKLLKGSDSVKSVTDGKVSVTIANCDQTSDSANSNQVLSDVTYASQLSLENPAGFSRDAIGRQSMSEKRHATLDAKTTGTYQRNKKLREEREKEKENAKQNGIVRVGSVESIISLNRSPGHNSEETDKLGELGPSLGMKKSSSLESLQTMVQGIQMRDDPNAAYSYRGNQGGLRVIRGRGCDDSFRAAVDVNYGQAVGNSDDNNAPKKHWLLDPPSHCEGDGHDVGFLNSRGGPRQSSLNAADMKQKGVKKKPGLLKGIGSMFRFGKHRKTVDIVPNLDHPIIVAHEPESASEVSNEAQQAQPAENGRPPSPVEQQQQQSSQQKHNIYVQQQHTSPPHLPPPQQNHYNRQMMHHQQHGTRSQNEINEHINPAIVARSQHVQELRAMHQKRHAERQGHYVSEEREDQYERAIRQRLDQPTVDTVHGRSASYDVYGDIGRPGSRSGITDPQRFSHYVNYDEIQHQLSNHKEQLSEVQIVQMRLQVQQQRLKVEEESRRQQHYHSQRQPQRDNQQQRPMSNFYEYESVQLSPTRQPLSPIGDTEPTSTTTNTKALSRQAQLDRAAASVSKQHFTQHARPYQPPPPPDPYRQLNGSGNPVNRHYQRYVANHNQRNTHRARGPFITQVTIEDQTQKTTSSRV